MLNIFYRKLDNMNVMIKGVGLVGFSMDLLCPYSQQNKYKGKTNEHLYEQIFIFKYINLIIVFLSCFGTFLIA